ncbi:hypothetical protein [Enterovibrio coralii]|uniref:Uncharacterized protein n=1 Tax=Enterovibrio coralii TaxID=294935 RepID=A0A135ICQ5_9GAMM|nr:hypothetical protein [Enterovibrio coralii]KXF83124.1 hypothetical protein ATN88_05280 [Enterovibrio coralii]
MTFRRPIPSKFFRTVIMAIVVAFSLNVKNALASLTIATWNMEWLTDKDDIIQASVLTMTI